ncbi:MAG: Gfo/Idh/MocA family oxidoreductase [Armatimonadetes bacterium]|nr:Gfo/Idh/MocA family oxidoreductase [Armatimonadota bacterium]
MGEPLRVAVVGAHGIGKHHAKWLASIGCEVTAIYGTTAVSVEQAAAVLRDTASFRGRAFSDWRAFLQEGDFVAASVCSPAEAHYKNVLDLLRAGKHVLCEKPLVWDWRHTPERMVAAAWEMVATAAAGNRILAVNAQYPAALPAIQALRRELKGKDTPFKRFDCLMETRGRPRSPHGAAEVWVDLGPHPLACVYVLAGGGGIRWDTLSQCGKDLETEVRFLWEGPRGELPVTIVLRRITNASPRRRFGEGEIEIDYEGRNQDGEFVAVLIARGREWVTPDFMRVSLERFVEAVRTGDPARAVVTGEAAAHQMEALVGVWARCWSAVGR